MGLRLIILLFLELMCFIQGQFLDDFQRGMCRERWKRMDWQQILRPCKDNLEFGDNKWDDSLRTSPDYSHVLSMDIKKVGEFSKIAIQSRTAEGREKTIGGDVWRVFIDGPSNIAPFVSDLENGVYEATFLVMEPGFYKAKIYLESTLCDGIKDPPRSVLKHGIRRDGRGKMKYGKVKEWQPIRGNGASFKVEINNKTNTREIQKRLNRWKDSCGANYKCDLLWNGFGRWVNRTWKPYIEDLEIPGSEEQEIFEKECVRKNSGKMLMYGDDFAKQFFDSNRGVSVLNGVFHNIDVSNNGFLASKSDLPKEQEFSIKSELRRLKEIALKPEMDEKSVLLLNYGLPFIDRMSFSSYRKMVDRAARTLDGYKGQVVVRTTSSLQKPTKDLLKTFETFQRTKLFNAYILSKMCAEGYPAYDIFDMTEATPNQPSHASEFDYSVVKPMDIALKHYFETRTVKRCAREKVFRKITQKDISTQMESESGSGSGNGSNQNHDNH